MPCIRSMWNMAATSRVWINPKLPAVRKPETICFCHPISESLLSIQPASPRNIIHLRVQFGWLPPWPVCPVEYPSALLYEALCRTSDLKHSEDFITVDKCPVALYQYFASPVSLWSLSSTSLCWMVYIACVKLCNIPCVRKLAEDLKIFFEVKFCERM